MKLILQRHTTPDILIGTCYGRTDLDLAATYEAEFSQVLDQLPKFKRIISSPLQRCHKLACFLGEQHNIEVEVEARLTEFDFGNWEGIAWDKIPRAELDQWADDFNHARPHGGETVAELEARIKLMLSDWHQQDRFENDDHTLLVSHSGVIRALMATLEGLDMNKVEIDFGGHLLTESTQGKP